MKKFIAIYEKKEDDQNIYELLMVLDQSMIENNIDLADYVYRCQEDSNCWITEQCEAETDEIEVSITMSKNEMESYPKIRPVNWRTESQ